MAKGGAKFGATSCIRSFLKVSRESEIDVASEDCCHCSAHGKKITFQWSCEREDLQETGVFTIKYSG